MNRTIRTIQVCRQVVQAAAIVLGLADPISAAGLTRVDREEGLRYLARTMDAVVEATSGLSSAQWNFKPAPGRWSVAEIVEHLALSEDLFWHTLTDQVMKAPAGEPGRDSGALDRMILTVIPDRTNKANAAPPLLPAGKDSPAAVLSQFLHRRARSAEFLKSTPDLREHVADSPLGQPMDGYQWLMFAAAHSERHTEQILEVKADPGFPAK